MLRCLRAVKGYRIHATNGDLGRVDQFFFDDRNWIVRYLVVKTGSWFSHKKVLLLPTLVLKVDWYTQHVNVNLSKEEIAASPDIDTERPVSRQHEMDILDHYRWPYYWLGEGLWNPYPYPPPLEDPTEFEHIQEKYARENRHSDRHLRSSREVEGYRLQALDGQIGHVEDIIVDDDGWTIRYFVANTQNFWPGGRHVLLAPQWISAISWEDAKVYVDLDREQIKKGPEFNSFAPVNREYEVHLYDYYGRPKYWEAPPPK